MSIEAIYLPLQKYTQYLKCLEVMDEINGNQISFLFIDKI